ncbi:MAG: FdtA/QdtA family cupin domain-containing protein [Candidatus Margulisbacteria bacterium]|nr:FdtA/QdtA family cupin domain-containing protein [Candidatus Margulisiibacteriota bacterium]
MDLLKEVKWVDLPSIRDGRGVLTAIESGQDIPFHLNRIFYMHHVVAERGGHAHRETDQVVVAAAGSFKLRLADGSGERTYELNDATKGLYIPKMVFIKISDISKDAVCLVLASTHYDIGQSIRSWEEYLKAIRNG